MWTSYLYAGKLGIVNHNELIVILEQKTHGVFPCATRACHPSLKINASLDLRKLEGLISMLELELCSCYTFLEQLNLRFVIGSLSKEKTCVKYSL